MCSISEFFQKLGMNPVFTHGVELLASAHNDRAGSARHLRVMRGDMGSQCLIGVVERLARLDDQPQALVFRSEIPEDIMPGHWSVAIAWLAPMCDPAGLLFNDLAGGWNCQGTFPVP